MRGTGSQAANANFEAGQMHATHGQSIGIALSTSITSEYTHDINIDIVE